jgi:hypothetical protein
MGHFCAKCSIFDLLLICIYFFTGKSDELVRFLLFYHFYWRESLTEELVVRW